LNQRRSIVPAGIPEALDEKFGQSLFAAIQWRAFTAKSGLEPETADLTGVLAALREFLMPVLDAIAEGRELNLVWKPGVGWQERSGMLANLDTVTLKP
jgi:hypothetical protein